MEGIQGSSGALGNLSPANAYTDLNRVQTDDNLLSQRGADTDQGDDFANLRDQMGFKNMDEKGGSDLVAKARKINPFIDYDVN